MTDDSELGNIPQELRTHVAWMLTALIDALFLAVWALIQWATGAVLDLLHLSWFDELVLWIARFLFAGGTLYPIVLNLYTDMRLMWLKSRARIAGVTEVVEKGSSRG